MIRILLIISFVSLFFVACSTDNDDSMSVEGVWKLTEYNVSDGFDINGDGIKSTNLLDEIDCENNEFLTFESNGVMSSNLSFNPNILIALLDGTTDDYTFNVACDEEGVIGFAANYTQKGETIIYNNHNASIIGNQLYVAFKKAVKIYNESFTEVVKAKDLTLVYTKQ